MKWNWLPEAGAWQLRGLRDSSVRGSALRPPPELPTLGFLLVQGRKGAVCAADWEASSGVN